MAGKCQFTAPETPSCELSALTGKPFCSKHLAACGTIEEMEQLNQTGLSTRTVTKQLRRAPEALSIDPETAAVAAALSPAPRREARSRPPLDPEVLGSQMAEQLVQAEMEDRMRRFGVNGRSGESTKKVPFKFSPRSIRADSTAILDSDGNSLLPPGWIGRWVRQQDHLGRPTASRAQEFEDYSYQAVKDKNGKTITSHLGVAMMAPPQQYALRVTEKAPLGGVTRDTMLESAEEVVRDGNRAIGVKAAHVYVGDEHGSERRVHEAST